MPRFKCDEITEAGFYWVRQAGRRTTIVEVKNIPLVLGASSHDMMHILRPGGMGWMPLHQETLCTFHGPIKPPKGFEPPLPGQ